MIPQDIERWFTDPQHRLDWQDVDLMLADVEFLPRLKAYLDDPAGAEYKKIEVLSALLALLEHDCPRDGGLEAARLAQDLRTTIRRHADIGQKAMLHLGPVKDVVLRSILGLSIPPEYPKWIIDKAREEGA